MRRFLEPIHNLMAHFGKDEWVIGFYVPNIEHSDDIYDLNKQDYIDVDLKLKDLKI